MTSKSAIKILEIHSFASSACRIYPCKGATWAVTNYEKKAALASGLSLGRKRPRSALQHQMLHCTKYKNLSALQGEKSPLSGSCVLPGTGDHSQAHSRADEPTEFLEQTDRRGNA